MPELLEVLACKGLSGLARVNKGSRILKKHAQGQPVEAVQVAFQEYCQRAIENRNKVIKI